MDEERVVANYVELLRENPPAFLKAVRRAVTTGLRDVEFQTGWEASKSRFGRFLETSPEDIQMHAKVALGEMSGKDTLTGRLLLDFLDAASMLALACEVREKTGFEVAETVIDRKRLDANKWAFAPSVKVGRGELMMCGNVVKEGEVVGYLPRKLLAYVSGDGLADRRRKSEIGKIMGKCGTDVSDVIEFASAKQVALAALKAANRGIVRTIIQTTFRPMKVVLTPSSISPTITGGQALTYRILIALEGRAVDKGLLKYVVGDGSTRGSLKHVLARGGLRAIPVIATWKGALAAR